MGQIFKQRQKTIHLAIAYLDNMLTFSDLFTYKFQDKAYFKDKHMLPLRMSNFLLASTCIIVASKFYEIDDRLIMSTDIQSKCRDIGNITYQDF